MCGLVGILGALEFKDEKAMKRLLVMDFFRGEDATGLAVLRKSGESIISKINSNPFDLFDMASFKSALNGTNSSIFMGHNRAKTRGENNKANAHPFEFDHIIGAHNGTLEWSSQKAIEDELGQKFDVDSQALFAIIAAKGIEEAMKYLKGAWSLTWIDKKQGTFNLLRNKERPMWTCSMDNGAALAYASEWRILDYGLNDHRKIEADKKGNTYFPTDENIHYIFDIDSMTKDRKVPRPKAVKREKCGELVKVSYTTTGNYSAGAGGRQASNPFHRQGPGFTTHSTGTSSTTTSPTTSGTERSTTSTKPSVYSTTASDPFGGQLSREEFEALAQHGCTLCGADLTWERAKGIAVWKRDDIILCSKHSPQDGDDNRVYVYQTV